MDRPGETTTTSDLQQEVEAASWGVARSVAKDVATTGAGSAFVDADGCSSDWPVLSSAALLSHAGCTCTRSWESMKLQSREVRWGGEAMTALACQFCFCLTTWRRGPLQSKMQAISPIARIMRRRRMQRCCWSMVALEDCMCGQRDSWRGAICSVHCTE